MKAVEYKPTRQTGALTTMVGSGIVTVRPGVNILDDRLLAGLKKNCGPEFKSGVLKEVKYKAPKATPAAPTQKEKFAKKADGPTPTPVKKSAKKAKKVAKKKTAKKVAKKPAKKAAKKTSKKK